MLDGYGFLIVFVSVVGFFLFLFEKIKNLLMKYPVVLAKRVISDKIISPHKRFLTKLRSMAPASWWSFLYHSTLWEHPYHFIRLYIACFSFNQFILAIWLRSAFSFFIALLLSLSFVGAILIHHSARNRFLFAQFLPLAINLLHDSVKAGLSFKQSLEVIVKESKDPVKKTFRNILHGLEMGLPLKTILDYEKQNVNNGEFSLLCNALTINSMTGGRLDYILAKIKLILVNRREFDQKVRISVASSKTNSSIAIAINIYFLISIMYVSPKGFNFFFNDPFGQKLLQILIFLIITNIVSFYIIVKSVKKV